MKTWSQELDALWRDGWRVVSMEVLDAGHAVGALLRHPDTGERLTLKASLAKAEVVVRP